MFPVLWFTIWNIAVEEKLRYSPGFTSYAAVLLLNFPLLKLLALVWRVPLFIKERLAYPVAVKLAPAYAVSGVKTGMLTVVWFQYVTYPALTKVMFVFFMTSSVVLLLYVIWGTPENIELVPYSKDVLFP